MTVNKEYYGFILDETADVANKEQINICFRVVHEEFLIEELFLDFMKLQLLLVMLCMSLPKMFFYDFKFLLASVEDSVMMVQQMFRVT